MRVDFDRTAVSADNLVGERETEPGALGFGSKKRVENPLTIFR